MSPVPPAQPPLPPLDTASRAAALECSNHLQQIAAASLLYELQHGNHLPDADKWTDELMPYLHDPAVLKCPEAPDLECAYAMNRALSGLDPGTLLNFRTEVLFFESNLGKRNASGTLADEARPARHRGGNNCAFGDGDVGWRLPPPSPPAPGAGGPAPAD
jgi:hypothetical protein